MCGRFTQISDISRYAALFEASAGILLHPLRVSNLNQLVEKLFEQYPMLSIWSSFPALPSTPRPLVHAKLPGAASLIDQPISRRLANYKFPRYPDPALSFDTNSLPMAISVRCLRIAINSLRVLVYKTISFNLDRYQ